MKLPVDPIRLRDERDPPDLAARLAGQAARHLAEPARISTAAMARIAARIEGARGNHRGSRGLVWAVVVGAFLLGIGTAASAAHLKWVPRWIARIVNGPAAPALPAPRSSAARSAGKRPWLAPPTGAGPAADLAPTTQSSLAKGLPPEPATAPGLPGVPALDGLRIPERRPLRPQGIARSPSSRLVADVEPARPLARVSATNPTHPPSLPAGPPPAPFLAWPAERPQPTPQASLAPSVALDRAVPSAGAAAPAPSSAGAQAPAPPSPSPVIAAAPTVLAPDIKQSARYLKQVVQALRIEHAPAQALALLDRYAGALAGAAFADEALLLRVEAMLALGQQDGVLRLLDGASLSAVAASHSLLVTRGELRAAANRCAEGLGDFDLVLAESPHPPKRALLGRAHCRDKLGDRAGATADRERYRREFAEDAPP